jgi:acyl dehydratase
MGSLYRHATPAPHTGTTRPPTEDGPRPAIERRVPIAAETAHVYTECSRIWNPIHTDARTAERAGLPGIILHGTATLAMAVTEVVRHDAEGQPGRVRRIGARFVGMVPMPSEIQIRVFPRTAACVPFDVQGPTGRPVLRDGTVDLGAS